MNNFNNNFMSPILRTDPDPDILKGKTMCIGIGAMRCGNDVAFSIFGITR